MSEFEYTADIADKIRVLPVSMKVSDVADFLGIALSTAYKLVKSPEFPIVEIPNIHRIVISKEHFLKWYYRGQN